MASRNVAPGRFSALFKRLSGQVADQAEQDREDPDTAGPVGSGDQAARQALAQMLDEAAGVLQGLGLPFLPGFYQWSRHSRDWTFLSSALSPAERRAIVLDAPISEGWRYATLPQLARLERPDDNAVRHAADVLEQGTACLDAADRAAGGSLEAAVKLAVAWAEFQIVKTGAAGDRRPPLKFHFPTEDFATPSTPPDTQPPKTLRKTPARKKPHSAGRGGGMRKRSA